MIGAVIDRRFFAFLLAGGVNTLVGYGLYSALVLVGLLPHLAVILSAIGGILFNFLTTGMVFQSRDARRLPRFVIAYGVLLGIDIALLDLLLRAGAGPFIGQGIALLVWVPLTFLTMRRFVFAEPARPLPEPNR